MAKRNELIKQILRIKAVAEKKLQTLSETDIILLKMSGNKRINHKRASVGINSENYFSLPVFFFVFS